MIIKNARAPTHEAIRKFRIFTQRRNTFCKHRHKVYLQLLLQKQKQILQLFLKEMATLTLDAKLLQIFLCRTGTNEKKVWMFQKAANVHPMPLLARLRSFCGILFRLSGKQILVKSLKFLVKCQTLDFSVLA